jgi:lipopolysaccharide exporter
MSADRTVHHGLEEKALRGVPWTVLAFATSKVLAIGTTLVLARILAPADFGVVALASLAIGTLQLFGDLGLGGALVVRQDLDEEARGTILTLMLVVSGATAALVAAISPLVGLIFNQPRLAGVLAALSVTVVVGGAAWFYETILQQELEFTVRYKAVLAQGLSGAGVAVTAALAGAGIWSLVAGQLVGSAVYAVALYRLTTNPIRPAFNRTAARSAVRAGRGFLAQGGLAFLELNVDYLVVGRLLGASQLGYYSMAFRVSELPYWAITEPVAKVTFPGFARMRRREETVTRSFLEVLRNVALVASPFGVLVSALAQPFVRTFLGHAWLPMVGSLSVLGLWGTLVHMEATLGWLYNSLGRAGLNARISALSLPPLLVGVVLAAEFGDIRTVSLVVLAHAAGVLVVRALVAQYALEIPLHGQWRAVRPVVCGAALAWAASRVTSNATAALPPAASLASGLAAGLVTYVGVVWLLEPAAVKRAGGQLRRLIGSAPVHRGRRTSP